MTKAEIEFRQLFTKAIRGDLSTARLIVDMATDHLAPRTRGGREYEIIGETKARQRFGSNWQNRIQQLNISRGY